MKPSYTKYDTLQAIQLAESISLKVVWSGSKTGGTQVIFEDIVQPGTGRHIHHKQDETFFFLEGEFDVEVDGERFHMQAGDVAFVPKGIVHAWKNVGATQGRLRYIFSPALNIEQMFHEIDEANTNAPAPKEAIEKIMQKYPHQEFVGPPL